MDIIFYKYSGYSNQLNKNFSDDTLTITGDFNIDFNTRDTTVKLQGYNDFDYNYCYIPSIKRYFFITNCNIRRNGIVFITLHVDVLQTYKEQINNAKIRLKNNSTDNTTVFKSVDIVNDDFTTIMVALGGNV